MTYSSIVCLLGFVLAACGSSHEASASGEVVGSSDQLAAEIAQSNEVAEAQAQIDRGHPWRATQLLGPVLNDQKRRTPAALVVAARAAAGWGGWREVERLLSKQRWVDTRYAGEGRELLTRAALEQNEDTLALREAGQALASARSAPARARRLVFLARALERNNLFDSAAATYQRASRDMPTIRDWLLLRVAGNEADSAERASALRAITLAAARPRVPWTDAQARERFSDALGAAAEYASLGAMPAALRLRLSVAPDSATRNGIKSEILAFVQRHTGTPDAKAAVEVLDNAFTSLTPAEQLIVGRAIAAIGQPARIVVAFRQAASQPTLLTPNDRLLYGEALGRAGRARDANAQFDAVTGPLAAQAMYDKARLAMTASTATALPLLRDIVTRFASDSAVASSALYLLGDLTTDQGDDSQARRWFTQLYHDYPTSVRAPGARFRAAIIALVANDAKTAAREFDSLDVATPNSDESTAARYWAGRAWADAGDKSAARDRWRDVITRQPTSYYAMLSARRLDERGWTPEAAPDSFPRNAAVDNAIARIDLLQQLGMDVEARFEADALESAASKSNDLLLATSHVLLEHGNASRAIRLAQKLIDGGVRDARAYRLYFPVLDQDELERDAKAHDLDPALVAGLIRQESAFNPHAQSAANARGLMQVLPSVGQEVAHNLHFPVWDASLLFDPDANLQLGTAHLASSVSQYHDIPRVLAAYNAGGSRVTRWVTKPGTDDPEIFAERIPYVETRDYVRIVQRNAAMYRELYKW